MHCQNAIIKQLVQLYREDLEKEKYNAKTHSTKIGVFLIVGGILIVLFAHTAKVEATPRPVHTDVIIDGQVKMHDDIEGYIGGNKATMKDMDSTYGICIITAVLGGALVLISAIRQDN